jgi:hypothetical protein
VRACVLFSFWIKNTFLNYCKIFVHALIISHKETMFLIGASLFALNLRPIQTGNKNTPNPILWACPFNPFNAQAEPGRTAEASSQLLNPVRLLTASGAEAAAGGLPRRHSSSRPDDSVYPPKFFAGIAVSNREQLIVYFFLDFVLLTSLCLPVIVFKL